MPVTFFGETARMPAGPATLAASPTSYLCPTDLSFTDERLGDPYPSADDAARHPAGRAGPGRHPAVADIFERGIGAHPADWHMLQPLWRADLDNPQGPAAAGEPEPVGQGRRP